MIVRQFFLSIVLSSVVLGSTSGWEWPDLMGGSIGYATKTLSMDQVSELRVREIKRRLTRHHGYGADEVGRMLDKKELIQTLSFEEHKVRLKELEEVKRKLFWKGIFTAVLVGALTLFWPLLRHLFEVAHVNFVVYTDRKWYEARRCWDYRSIQGCIGVALMGIIDLLQVWMTVSILGSWVITSKYFFPMPSLPIRPAAMMGGPIAQGPLASYGINIAPMLMSWGFRFVHSKLESWVGRALRRTQARQRREEKRKQRASETPEQRACRKAAKRASKVETTEEEATTISISLSEMRHQMAQAAETKRAHLESNTAFDDLD